MIEFPECIQLWRELAQAVIFKLRRDRRRLTVDELRSELAVAFPHAGKPFPHERPRPFSGQDDVFGPMR